MAKAGKLPEFVKEFIVDGLAMGDTPSQVVDAVKEEWLDKDGKPVYVVSRQLVDTYNPRRAGKKPAQKWVDRYTSTRDAFRKQVGEIPAANRAVRIRRLERMALAAERLKNYVLAKDLYRQIAEEVGRVYTNKRTAKLQGDADAPFVFVPATGGKPMRQGDGADAA